MNLNCFFSLSLYELLIFDQVYNSIYLSRKNKKNKSKRQVNYNYLNLLKCTIHI